MNKLNKILLGVAIAILAIVGVTYATKTQKPVPAPITPAETIPEKDNEQLEAKINQTISAFGIQITPLEVLEDSRCPADVQCIQAGTVRLKMLLKSGENEINATFTLNEPVSTDTATVTLVNVEPGKISTVTALPADYRFFFKVAKVEPVFCTMEAKLCPDGTGVGRSGPNCEFAPCPGE